MVLSCLISKICWCCVLKCDEFMSNLMSISPAKSIRWGNIAMMKSLGSLETPEWAFADDIPWSSSRSGGIWFWSVVWSWFILLFSGMFPLVISGNPVTNWWFGGTPILGTPQILLVPAMPRRFPWLEHRRIFVAFGQLRKTIPNRETFFLHALLC